MGTSKDPVGEGLNACIKGIGRGFAAAFYGIKKLTAPGPIVGVIISVAIAVFSYFMKAKVLSMESIFGVAAPLPVRYIIYWLLLLVPLFYLIVLGKLGSSKIGKYDEVFREISLSEKDGKLPVLLSEKKEEKKTTFVFSSKIPLSEWKKARDKLETGLDCNIRQIKEGNSKKVVELITVPSSIKIPDDLSWNDTYISDDDGVVCIGENELNPIFFDLNRTPHVICAGETGSGKSVLMRCILNQLAQKGCRIFMMDFKGGIEFGKRYEQFGEVVTERDRALEILQMLAEENNLRQALFRNLDCKNLKQYNKKTGENLCRIVVLIDELAELMEKKGVDKSTKGILEKIEGLLASLSRTARATGINLIFGVQRPDANVLPGQIKNNVPVRICGRFADRVASDIVLGNNDATELPDIKGRFLFRVGNEMTEFQAFFFDDDVHLHGVCVKQGDLLIERSEYDQEEYEEYEEVDDPEEELEGGEDENEMQSECLLDLDFDRGDK